MKKDKNFYLLPNIKMEKETIINSKEHEKAATGKLWFKEQILDPASQKLLEELRATDTELSFDIGTAADLTEEELALKDKIKWEINLYDPKSFEKLWKDIWTEIENILNQIGVESDKYYKEFEKIRQKLIKLKLPKEATKIDRDDFAWKLKWLLASRISLCDELIPIFDNLLTQNKAKLNELKLYIIALIEIKNGLSETEKNFIENDWKIDESEQKELVRLLKNEEAIGKKQSELAKFGFMALSNAKRINSFKRDLIVSKINDKSIIDRLETI